MSFEGCIPFHKAMKTSKSVEEERRVLYVAMTRAKDFLELTIPEFHFSHMNSDEIKRARPSRFIPKELSNKFDCRNRSSHGRTYRNK